MTQDLQKRTLFAGIALAIFLPILMVGGLLLQIAIGIIAMLAMHELLKMRGLETMTMEGLLTLFATFALTIPLENYLTFLPVDGNVVAYSVLISIMLGTTVFSKSYTIEDAVFPLAMSFYVGFGFNAFTRCSCCRFGQGSLSFVYRLGDRQWCLSCWDELWETKISTKGIA